MKNWKKGKVKTIICINCNSKKKKKSSLYCPACKKKKAEDMFDETMVKNYHRSKGTVESKFIHHLLIMSV